ncbi:aminopeptidase P family protein (plasmid) [Agrobacterium fabrum]|uniref:Agropine synthesis cyclase n=1 Tax=Rhizobium rhizogenes TaxID=359 RepID=AGS_RHIRH|nr:MULTISPECIES: Xaa-Pro peptidase family protein [Rhizobium/Agrobacterium group]P27875.1 RecName: Full=Agropine synthesis cyclase [Rhizobium rhizogenes]KEA04414.1 hypothetical protein CN09_18920 [Rhizobium rhizogenes]NMV72534.1 aminopeptidase P family protein [Agrobacterium fabrum]NTI85401.1 aminopeptidase P family protein [Rhizobium rhizogenes]NTJ27584.1 aminopeptidase P family protein [Rhizobium rhizogenes]QRM41773.1 aminopeptidase P family protein [Rhizobium rhizogenes]
MRVNDSPSDEVYQTRLQGAQTAMKRAGIDVLALSGPDFHNYFAGLWGLPVGRPVWFVLQQYGKPAFVAPRSEAREISARCKTPVAVEWVEWEGPIAAPMTNQDALAQYTRGIAPNPGLIGLDFNCTSGANVELVRQALGAEHIKDVTPMLQELWACKDAAGIAAIRQSCDIVREQFLACRNAIAPGIPEWKVTLASVTAAIERNGELLAEDEELPRFWPHQLNMVGSGADRTARCHPSGGGRIMQDGAIAQICLCGQTFRGHAACFDRPVPIGSKPLPANLRKVIDVAREAQSAALAALRPGVTAGEIHAAAVAVIKRSGWEAPFLHRTGRGIGYSDWDGIELKAGSQTVLEVGNVLSIEPGVYVQGIGGARFGDTVLVSETGYEVLTPFDLGRNI